MLNPCSTCRFFMRLPNVPSTARLGEVIGVPPALSDTDAAQRGDFGSDGTKAEAIIGVPPTTPTGCNIN